MHDPLAHRLAARFMFLSPLAGLFAALLFLAATNSSSVSASQPRAAAESSSAQPAPIPPLQPNRLSRFPPPRHKTSHPPSPHRSPQAISAPRPSSTQTLAPQSAPTHSSSLVRHAWTRSV